MVLIPMLVLLLFGQVQESKTNRNNVFGQGLEGGGTMVIVLDVRHGSIVTVT